MPQVGTSEFRVGSPWVFLATALHSLFSLPIPGRLTPVQALFLRVLLHKPAHRSLSQSVVSREPNLSQLQAEGHRQKLERVEPQAQVSGLWGLEFELLD